MKDELVGLGYGLLFWLGFGGLALAVGWIGGALHARRMRRRQRERLTSDFSRLRGRMTRMARPTLLLIPARSPVFSKLGGKPDLPIGVSPPSVRGKSSWFLAQLDLQAFRNHAALDWLPEGGRLFFFVDPDGYGFADQVQVLHVGGETGAILEPSLGVAHFPERRIAFEQYVSLPSLDWLAVDVSEPDLSDAELDLLADAPDEPFGDEIQHRIGGYPSEIQGGQMAVECELIRRGLPGDGETEITPRDIARLEGLATAAPDRQRPRPEHELGRRRTALCVHS